MTNFKNVLQVQLREAAPNKMFSEAQRAAVRFLHYSRSVECAECGRRSRHHWTSLLSFQAMDFEGSYGVLRSATGKVHAPLSPVCGKHPLATAEMPLLQARKRNARKRTQDVLP